MVSFCVFTFLRLKAFSTFTLQKKVVERFWGYRVLERIKTHRLRPTPALYDPQTYEFFRFYVFDVKSIFDVYPSYFDRIPKIVSAGCSSRQRASFLFLIHFWVSLHTYLKILQKSKKDIKKIPLWSFGPWQGHCTNHVLYI